MLIKVKHYEHFNRSLPNWDTPKGKYISSRKQYEEEMKKGGFVDYDEGCKRAQQNKNNKGEYTGLSSCATSVIKAARLQSDKKGRIKPSGRLLDAMKEVGVKFSVPDWCPKKYREIK